MSETTVISPCIRACALDADDICIGCYRTRAELKRWMSADDEEKLQIIASAKARELEDL